jgi:hypothetical protein
MTEGCSLEKKVKLLNAEELKVFESFSFAAITALTHSGMFVHRLQRDGAGRWW